jgi:hypothetical protein
LGLQQPSGVFAGDAFGETDTRFLYCAVSALSLLGALDRLDRARTVEYLASCRNFDGGFGRVAGAESHAAQGITSIHPPIPPCLFFSYPYDDDDARVFFLLLLLQCGCARRHSRF